MTGAASVRIARARGEADAAKVRLSGTMDELKARLAPAKLASDAVQTAKDKSIVAADDAVTAVKERPGVAVGVAAAAAMVVARKPLFAALRGLFRRSPKPKPSNKRSRSGVDLMEEEHG